MFQCDTKGCTTVPASVLTRHCIQFEVEKTRSIEPRKAVRDELVMKKAI